MAEKNCVFFFVLGFSLIIKVFMVFSYMRINIYIIEAARIIMQIWEV